MNGFKLCAFADEAYPKFENQIKALNDNGIPLIELRGVDGKNFTQLSVFEMRDIRKRLDDSGISVWALGSPIGKIRITDEFKPHLDLFRHTLELADAAGAKNIRMFSFYSDNHEASRDEVLYRLSVLADEVRGTDITLCHENEKDIFGESAENCRIIHENIPSIKAVFDPANFVDCGEDTLKAWDTLSGFVKYMHIKDKIKDGEIVPAGEGDGNILKLISLFKQIGGQVLTLEPHLANFVGLANLEIRDVTQRKVRFTDTREAFDCAADALKALIKTL